jgi:hypothetical protein
MPPRLRFAAVIALLACCTAAAPPDGNPRAVYFTVGDAQDLLEFPPLDSKTSIAACFETLKEQWQVERIWWRGGQDEIWGEQFVIRPENRIFAKVWDWWRDLQYRKVGTNRIAVEEAHQRGMQIWLTHGLFDNGSHADAGYSGFPYAIEDKLRIDHPEWAPVNRWGTWRQGGPIELAYPEARQAMADYLTKYVVEGNYDGIAFLTYAENFSQRYEDEFGYNDPIVDEFRQKFDVDIRTQEFDRAEWRKLRGSYVTEFLRLLKKQLSPHGKKIAVSVHGLNPDRPMLWLVDGGVCTAGNVTWSIDEWLNGDVVDEINLFTANTNESVQKLIDQANAVKSPVQVTAFRSRGELPAGVPRVMFLGREIESGYESDAWIDYPDEKLTPEPAASLDGDDVYARRRLLTLALKGKLKLTAEQYRRALQDEDIFVRRTALRALAKSPVPDTAAAIRDALRDPENTVRCLAALALAESDATDIVENLLAAAFHPEGTFQLRHRAVADALKKMAATNRLGPAEKQRIVEALSASESDARELALYYFTLVGAPATPDVERRLTEIVTGDENEYSRELALVNLRSSFGATAGVVKTVRDCMQYDSSHAVQVRAAAAFASLHARLPADDPARSAGLQESLDYFSRYGDGCERSDRDWGWRLLGNTILEFGPEGEAAFQRLMKQTDNKQLADRAWRMLYLKQGDRFFPITEAEDIEAHRLRP